MTEYDNSALRRLASRVLTHHTGTDVGADALGAAASRAYDELARAAAQLVGAKAVAIYLRESEASDELTVVAPAATFLELALHVADAHADTGVVAGGGDRVALTGRAGMDGVELVAVG